MRRWLAGFSITFPTGRRARRRELERARRIYYLDLSDDERAERIRAILRDR